MPKGSSQEIRISMFSVKYFTWMKPRPISTLTGSLLQVVTRRVCPSVKRLLKKAMNQQGLAAQGRTDKHNNGRAVWQDREKDFGFPLPGAWP